MSSAIEPVSEQPPSADLVAAGAAGGGAANGPQPGDNNSNNNNHINNNNNDDAIDTHGADMGSPSRTDAETMMRTLTTLHDKNELQQLLEAFEGIVNVPANWHSTTELDNWAQNVAANWGTTSWDPSSIDLGDAISGEDGGGHNDDAAAHHRAPSFDGCVFDLETAELKEIVVRGFGKGDAAKLAGKLQHLQHLPSQLVRIDLAKNKLTCDTLQLSVLPRTLVVLNLAYNDLTGPLDLSALPRSLQSFSAGWNKFSGPIDLSALPPNMRLLSLSANKNISGPINISSFPATMRELHLSETKVSGTIDLGTLNEGFERLDCHHTNLSGDISLARLPRSLLGLRLNHTRVSGSIVFDDNLPPNLQRLHLHSTQLTCDEPLDVDAISWPQTLRELYLHSSCFRVASQTYNKTRFANKAQVEFGNQRGVVGNPGAGEGACCCAVQ